MGKRSKISVLDDVRGLVRQNEIEIAVDQLCNLLKDSGGRLYNEVILHSSRLLELRRRERRGVVTAAEALAEGSRIREAVLALVDEIATRPRQAPLPFETDAVKLLPPDDAGLEKIFGINHLKSIAWLRRGLDVARSVGRIVTPEGLGTGFLIKGDSVLTNHHVIPNERIAKDSCIEFGYEEDLVGTVSRGHTYALSRHQVWSNPELDYTIVTIEPDSGLPALSTWGTLELDTACTLSPGDHVTIIQHPQGGPKQIAVTANQVVNIYEHRLQYTTDTLPGSSGAPVFNDDWRVVAIHHAGGNRVVNARGDRMFANEGILVSHILSDSELCRRGDG